MRGATGIALAGVLAFAGGVSALSIDGAFGGGAAEVTVKHIPSTEPIAALSLHFTFHRADAVGEMIASAPACGLWSQVGPEVVREGEDVTVMSVAPTYVASADTVPAVVFRVRFQMTDSAAGGSFAQTFDSIWVGELIDADGREIPGIGLALNDVTGVKGREPSAPRFDITCRRVQREYRLSFRVAAPTYVKVTVMNAKGQAVRNLLRRKVAGMHTVGWDGCNEAGAAMPGGTYFLQLQTGTATYNKRISLVK
jgi:hypothetical protein